MWDTNTIWFEIAIVSSAMSLGYICLGHFEERSTFLKKFFKYVIALVIIIGCGCVAGCCCGVVSGTGSFFDYWPQRYRLAHSHCSGFVGSVARGSPQINLATSRIMDLTAQERLGIGWYTNGNPYFLSVLARHLANRTCICGARIAIP